MTVATSPQLVTGGEHAVHFYEHELELLHAVGGYLADAMQDGAQAIVIATDAHRRAFDEELEARGITTARARRNGTIVSLDAERAIASFTSGGRIDAAAFDRVIGDVVRRAAGSGRSVTAYGEMVALLWNAGNVVSAIELEQLWNELAAELDFDLLCAYQSDTVSGADQAEALGHICDLHSSVTRSVSREFPAHVRSPRAARTLVAETLRGWGYEGRLLYEAQLVVSELATNAVVYSHNQFSVLVGAEGPAVRISVRDLSSVKPVPRPTDPDAVAGRGLQLVGAIANDWGTDMGRDGKTVWAELRS